MILKETPANELSGGRQKRIKAIIDETATKLAAEGAGYFIGAIDLQPKEPDGVTLFTRAEVAIKDLCLILISGLSNPEDFKALSKAMGHLSLAIIEEEKRCEQERT